MSGLRDCSEYDIMLSARLDGELSEDEERELEEHLASCPECRKYLRLLETVRDGLQEDLPAPPETLAQGVMYKVGLEKKRGRLVYGAFGRWTAIAAVICIVIFGAVKLKESGLQKSMTEAPAAMTEGHTLRSTGGSADGVMNAAAAPEDAAVPQADAADVALAVKTEGSLEEAKHPVPAATGMPMPAPSLAAEAPGSAAGDVGTLPQAENEMLDEGSVYRSGSLPGYDVGRAALGDGDYRSVCIFYGALPETVDTEKWLTERPGEGELNRWLVSAEELRSLETEGGWNEFYYGDLTSGQGLVIVIAGEEE